MSFRGVEMAMGSCDQKIDIENLRRSFPSSAQVNSCLGPHELLQTPTYFSITME
jgi:hypothetical protein